MILVKVRKFILLRIVNFDRLGIYGNITKKKKRKYKRLVFK